MTRVIGIVILALCLAMPAFAQPFTPAQQAEIVQIVRDALKHDPSILRGAIETLQADEGHQHETATRAAIAASRDELATAADPVGGNPAGEVTIVEFFDPRCPFCRRIEPTMAQLLGHDRSVRLVYKDLPILGPSSLLGSKALLAAQRQGGYEKLRTAMMAGTADITKETIRKDAQLTGLDWPRLEKDMEDPSISMQLEKNVQLAHKLGIEGTPAFVVGETLIPGAVELPELQKAVEAARPSKG